MRLVNPCRGRRLSIERLEGRQLLAVEPHAQLFDSGASSPERFTAVGSNTFFVASDASHGSELWVTDGLPGGTHMVKDIKSGTGGSGITYLANVNGTLFFNANNGSDADGNELWKSDGTSTGTTMVRDINTSADPNSSPYQLVNLGGTLLFRANDGTHGNELWKSDGTSAGTTMVNDIWSGGNGSAPSNLTLVGSTLYFSANDGSNGNELWKSDGTSAGTTLVKDINSGLAGSMLTTTEIVNVSGTLFFRANDGTNGAELWKSNGTSTGTSLVKDINGNSTSSTPFFLTNFNGTLLFAGTDSSHGTELWKSDGTSTGTTMVKDINPTGSNSALNASSRLTVADGTVYFQANDGSNGIELWKSDGTSSGTSMVADIRAGSDSSSPDNMAYVHGLLFFRANDGTNGKELWQTDGTSSGTKMVRNINSGSGDSSPNWIVVAGSNNGRQAFFAANDGTNGVALWQLIVAIPGDGNLDGTVNGADYTIWADHFHMTGAYWQIGDFNDDEYVAGADYTVWADHYGQSE